MNMEEMEIDLKQLCIDIMKQWRKILIGMVVVGILAAAFGAYKKATEEPIDEEELHISYEKVELVKEYKDRYEKQSEYNVESALMKLDPYEVPNLTVRYKIASADMNNELPLYELDNIATQYVNMANSQKSFNDISSLTGIETRYLREYLSITASRLSQEGEQNETKNIVYILNFSISGVDENTCNQIADYYDAMIMSPKSNIVSMLGEHVIEKLDSKFTCDYSQGIFDKQQSNISLVQTYRDEYDRQYKALSDEEKALFDEDTDTLEVEITAGSIVKSGIKFGIIGAVAGAVLVCGIWVVILLLNGKLQSTDSLESMSGIKTYICPANNKEVKGLDKFIATIQGKAIKTIEIEKVADIINSELSVLNENEKIENVFISSSNVNDDAIKAAIEAVKKPLSGINVLTADGSVANSADAVKMMGKADRIVLIEKKDVSAVSEIAKELNVCKEYGKKVLCFVALN